MNLNQAKPAPKQLNFLKLGDASGFIFNGYLTQTEPIFESRAVYISKNEVAGEEPLQGLSFEVGFLLRDPCNKEWENLFP